MDLAVRRVGRAACAVEVVCGPRKGALQCVPWSWVQDCRQRGSCVHGDGRGEISLERVGRAASGGLDVCIQELEEGALWGGPFGERCCLILVLSGCEQMLVDQMQRKSFGAGFRFRWKFGGEAGETCLDC